ncbi:hypothetical protein K2X85_01820 [bacterium]|nr:hypothetical protein [bacterium]
MNRALASPPVVRWPFVLAGIGLVLAAGSILFLTATAIPLGIVGEWVWNRSPVPPTSLTSWLIPAIASGLYLVVFVAGDRLIDRAWWIGRAALLLMLLGVAACWQRAAMDLPSPPLGMERFAPALFFESTSGYFARARQIDRPDEFLRGYKEWVSKADSFHQGTHPPGLILFFRGLLTWFQREPALADTIEQWSPARLRDGLEAIGQPLAPADRATLLFASLLTWALSLATGPLIYATIRQGYSPRAGWWGAALWSVLPAGLFFLPLADVLFPFLAMLTWLLVILSFRARIGLLAILAGAIGSVGLFLSLAFVVVGAIAGAIVLSEAVAKKEYRRGIITIACLLAGLALPMEALFENYKISMIEVWQINLAKHAGFYTAMPRSYFPWLGINLVELAMMTGPSLFVVALAWGFRSGWHFGPTSPDRLVTIWLVVLIALDLSGRNRSEAARLWLFLTPVVPVASACWGGQSGSAGALAMRVVLILFAMVGTLVLLGWVEPLLPVVLSP